ncbi:MAG: S46 family peptidase [Acidobacteria bacterium]|nr:MAG: S46 family peptidase [Acidobacteriota bacterium]
MTTRASLAATVFCLAALAESAPPALADEGMWTFDNLPRERLARVHGFTPDDAWLTRLQRAAVRFGRGGSGSFVGSHGLVLTNHHVVAGGLQRLEATHPGLIERGFLAAGPDDELPLPNLEIRALIGTRDVTAAIAAAVERAGEDPAARARARAAAAARLVEQAEDGDDVRAEFVELYEGAQSWIYRYRVWDDVRLVWVPEQAAANFGGDPDNFTYPRHDLDAALVRVWKDGRPVDAADHLVFADGPVPTGALVFVAGHPGNTDRLQTVAQLRWARDRRLPESLEGLRTLREAIARYAARGADEARKAQMPAFFVDNAIKSIEGRLGALRDEHAFGLREDQERELRARVAADPELARTIGDPWTTIERFLAERGDELLRLRRRSQLTSPWIRSMSWAMQLVLMPRQRALPEDERLPGYRESELARRQRRMLAPVPVFADLEAVMLGHAFARALALLPEDDPARRVVASLGDPAAAARALTTGTTLADPDVRRRLLEGGAEAIAASDDPMIALARRLAPIVEQDARFERDVVDAALDPAREAVGRARFAIYGTSAYPDATGTLRLAFGRVEGYPMNGTLAPPRTTLFGLFDRSLGFDRRPPWALPDRFWERRDRLDLATPVNFVCSCDIVGGNSGSPVVDREGRLVGLIFDGNIESLANTYVFDPERSRAVAVSAQYILQALDKLYDAGDLAVELRGGPQAPR